MSFISLPHVLTRLGAWAAHPLAFAIVLGYAAFWLVVSPESFDWHGLATLATWLMTLVITRAEYRDTQAIHAKLDELLLVQKDASSELSTLDEKEPEEIRQHRAAAKTKLDP